MKITTNKHGMQTFGTRLTDAAVEMGAEREQLKLSAWFKERGIKISGPMINNYRNKDIRRWDFGGSKGPFLYAFVIHPSGNAYYYDFRGDEKTSPSQNFTCK